MKKLVMLVVACVGFGVSAAAISDEYTDQVKQQLALIKALSSGWEETHNDWFDKLNHSDSDTFTFNLRQGTAYKVVAVCDNDCSDLDLNLFDPNGVEVADDTSTDSVPMIEARPNHTGKYSLKVTMYACSENPCYYGISILGK